MPWQVGTSQKAVGSIPGASKDFFRKISQYDRIADEFTHKCELYGF